MILADTRMRMRSRCRSVLFCSVCLYRAVPCPAVPCDVNEWSDTLGMEYKPWHDIGLVSHRISSHRIASHRIPSYGVVSFGAGEAYTKTIHFLLKLRFTLC
uniref:Secreted protein n=1 Tax=Pseudo-nitzschia australis TaxID=44445 RepID=A0A6U9ZY39_9STRA